MNDVNELQSMPKEKILLEGLIYQLKNKKICSLSNLLNLGCLSLLTCTVGYAYFNCKSIIDGDVAGGAILSIGVIGSLALSRLFIISNLIEGYDQRISAILQKNLGVSFNEAIKNELKNQCVKLCLNGNFEEIKTCLQTAIQSIKIANEAQNTIADDNK